METNQFDSPGAGGGQSARLLSHQDAKAKKSRKADEPIISLDRAQRALRNLQSGNSELKAVSARVLAEFMEERGAKAPASSAATTGAAPSGGATQADVALAFTRGAASERARLRAVFDHSDSRGRERGCANLLLAPQAWSAEAITRELASLPTDREIGAGRASEQAAARWEKANTATSSRAEQILANQRAATGKTPKAQEPAPTAQTKSQERWAKANAKAEQILAHQRVATGREY